MGKLKLLENTQRFRETPKGVLTNMYHKMKSRREVEFTLKDFHDRFLVIDKTEVYHIGASIKDAGKKSFGITKIEDKDLIQSLINKVR